MNNKLALASMAMDLKRVALAYHNKSLNTAKRFYEEALKRKDEVDLTTVKPYVQKILRKVALLETQKSDRIAEDALMYSTLLQNYVKHLS